MKDVGKSAAFYAQIFGDTVLKEKKGARHYVKAGPNYLVLTPSGQGPAEAKVQSYLCLGIQNFQMKEGQRSLEQAGISWHEAPGAGLLVIDPDGVPIQLADENSWSQLEKIASPVSMAAGEPRIRPTQINHLLLAVPDPDKSAFFYEKLLGSPISRSPQPQRIWFAAGKDRVGLSALPANPAANKDEVNGQHIASSGKLGLDHFGLIAPFDRATLTRQLQEAGAKVLPQVTSGPDAAALDFRDPDGYRVQIAPPQKSAA